MSIESADNILHVKNSTMRISRVEVGQTLSVGNIEFDTTTTLASVTSNGNNTTPHTISSSNVTTGLATTANVVVGGDLIVGGTSLVNAIYPVGTVIDRATAITDTHPNGKYKAFLSAPNQEWELVPSVQCSFNVYWDPSVASIYYAPGTHIQDWKVATHGHDTGGDFQLSGTNSQKFVAPSNGTYLFGLKYFPTTNEAIGNVALFKNGVYKDTLFATNHTGIYRIRTGVTTLLLTAGDVVHLGMSRAGDTWYKVDPHTQPDFIPARFYGFKIEGSTDNYKYKRTL